ncbi:MAG: redox-regulated ATPase YchF [Arenicellales bacterium]|nr:redox-regulated ATPase YchF [Arenicellales bacterium]
MGFRCGIVGLPNAGKSTLFNALTRAAVPAENYPFCTIEPNTGVVEVPDKRLSGIAQLSQPEKIIPTVMEFVDIAGLVAGASRGEGLGNRFLGHIREVDAIAHVVRGFQRVDVSHVEGRIDPVADIETIDTELALADLETLERALDRAGRAAKTGDKAERERERVFAAACSAINSDVGLKTLGAGATELLRPLCLLTAKPMLFVVNVEEEAMESDAVVAVESHAKAVGAETIAVNAPIEQEIAGLAETERREFLHELGLVESGLDRVVEAGYRLLELHTFFTAGPKEVRAWTIPVGTRAAQAAGKIHTDFERGFIRAETIAFDDFISLGGEKGAREAGRLRLEGRDYVVNDGDILNFRFNV